MIWLLFAFLILVTPAQAGVSTPMGSTPWPLIFDEEFNATGDYTHLNDGRTAPVWNRATGVGTGTIGTCPAGDDCNNRGGNYCWLQHGITLHGHEVDFQAQSPCWVPGSTQTGEGARIGTGPQDSGTPFTCSPTGQVMINGVQQTGFCFSPTDICPHATAPEIYEEALYDVPCNSGTIADHPVFWNIASDTTDEEFDIAHPGNSTQMFSETFGPKPARTNTQTTPRAACGWHVFGAHWIGGSSPSIEFWQDGIVVATVTANVTTSPMILMLELGWDGTPITSSVAAVGKAIYTHVYGNNVSYPAITAQTNYGGPGDTAGKTLGAP